MLAHEVLIGLEILRLSSIERLSTYESITEIGSEMLFHLTCVLMSQLNSYGSATERDNIESVIFLCLSVIVFLNIV